MPNLLITNFCNRSCPYCFALAQVELGTTRPNWTMSAEEYETVLGYLDPRWHPVSLLGGEPTLHPDFVSMVDKVIGRGYQTKVFTNGTTENLRGLPDYPGDQLRIILNLNSPDTYSPGEWGQIEKNFARFGQRISLSFNVTGSDFDWSYLRQAITSWNLQKKIRIGVTQPIYGMQNSYLSDEEFNDACKRLVLMAEDLASDGIVLGFDCGFRVCGFSREDRGILAQLGSQFLFDCRPILDIGPDLMVWRCFPFSTQGGLQLTDFTDLADLEDYFESRWRAQALQGNTDQCDSCVHRKNQGCKGGCLSRTMKRLSEAGFHA